MKRLFAIWQSPFNKVVRSHEALIGGFLAGLVTGLALVLILTLKITFDDFEKPIKLCDEFSNIESIEYRFDTKLHTVVCKDGRKFNNF